MQFLTGISRNTLSKSYMLLLTVCVWEFKNSAFWDTHYHALLIHQQSLVCRERPIHRSIARTGLHEFSVFEHINQQFTTQSFSVCFGGVFPFCPKWSDNIRNKRYNRPVLYLDVTLCRIFYDLSFVLMIAWYLHLQRRYRWRVVCNTRRWIYYTRELGLLQLLWRNKKSGKSWNIIQYLSSIEGFLHFLAVCVLSEVVFSTPIFYHLKSLHFATRAWHGEIF